MEKLRGMLCDELEKITDRGSLTADTLTFVDKITHSIKSIDTIMAMEDAGYSEDYYGDNYDNYDSRDYSRNSYARGRGRNAKRDSMGRYANDGRYSYERRGRYSRDDGKQSMVKQLEQMMESAPGEQERNAIMQALNHLEND